MSLCLLSEKVIAKNLSDPSSFLRPENRLIFLGFLFSFCLISVPCFLFYFIYYHKRYSRLKIRKISLVVLYPLALLFYAFSELLPELIGIQNFPCGLQAFIFLIIVPSIGTTNLCRNIVFLLTTKFSRATFLYGKITVTELLEEEEFISSKKAGTTIFYRIYWSVKVIWYGLRHLFVPEAIMGEISQKERRRLLFSLRFLTTNRSIILTFILLSFPLYFASFLIVVSDPVYVNCYGCRRTEFITYLALGESVIYLFFSSYVAIRARKLPDTFGLLKEGRTSLALILIAFVGFIITVWVPIDANGTYDNELIVTIGLILAWFSVSVWQVILSKRFESPIPKYHQQHHKQMSSRKTISENVSHPQKTDGVSSATTGGSALMMINPVTFPGLADILENEAIAKKFEEFLVQEFTQESLFFLRDSYEWKMSYYDISESARLIRARRIVATYVNPSGLFAINIPDSRKIIEEITTQSVDIDISFFDQARQHVCRLLEIGSVKRFQNSKIYKETVTGAEVIAAMDH